MDHLPFPRRSLSQLLSIESKSIDPCMLVTCAHVMVAAAMMGLGVATSGVLSNLVVYLIKEYNVPSVDAAQISNIVAGCLSLAPVAGAVVADAFFGCYPIVAISMAFSVLVSDYSVVPITVVCFLDRIHNTTGSSTCC